MGGLLRGWTMQRLVWVRMHALSACLEVHVALMESDAVRELAARQLAAACDWPDEQRDRLSDAISQRYGAGVQAIVIYGSYLRGKRDTLLDFYVLLDSYAVIGSRWQALLAWMLPPNVYQIRCGNMQHEVRAKYALMTLKRFERAMKSDFHSYFWARFAQPCGLAYCRDEAARQRVVRAISDAAVTFVRRVVPRLPDRFNASDLVRSGLSLTYRCELRSETQGHVQTLYDHYEKHYQTMVAALSSAGLGYHRATDSDKYINETGQGTRRLAGLSWWLRKQQGKLLSALRLFKAVLTFSDGFDYLIWKISRHSGLSIEPTARQRKYPLIFGWTLLWRLYRRGAFR
jgi:hypothetical protein